MLSFVGVARSAPAQGLCLEEQSAVAVAANPNALLAADLNGDGYDDILTLSTTGMATALTVVLSQNAPASYGASTIYPSPAEAYAFTVADVDGTSGLDVIVGASSQPYVMVFRNLGAGTLDTPFYVPTTALRAYAIAACDIDADSIVDVLISTDLPAPAIHVLKGQGGGLFGADVVSMIASPTNTPMACADIDQDGLPDLAMVDASIATVRVLRNLGAGAFGPMYEYGPGPGASSIRAGNLNGDSWPDLVAGTSAGIFVFLNDGTGQFPNPLDYGGGLDATFLILRDFDGNGALDVATKSTERSNLLLLLNTGSGVFAAGQPGEPLPYSYGEGANLDGDTRPDLISLSTGDSASVLLIRNPGASQQATQTILPAGDRPVAIASADFNSDGRLDFVVANFDANTVSVLLGAPGGTYAAPVAYPVGSTPVAVVTGDVTGDGLADIAVVNRSSNNVSVLKNAGNGTFLPHVVTGTGFSPVGLAVGDLDGVPPLDLAVVNSNSSSVTVLSSFPGGGFAAPVVLSAGQYPSSIAIGDINQDGLPDIVSGTLGDGLYFHTRIPGGGFTTTNALAFPPPAPVRSIEIADLDASTAGNELALAIDANVTFVRQSSPGTFNSAQAVTVNVGGGLVRDVSVGNFDAAPGLDIVAVAYSSTAAAAVGLWSGGATGPSVLTMVGTGPSPRGVIVGQFDADLLSDVAVISESSDAIWITRGQPGGQLGVSIPNYTGTTQGDMILADLDLDQKLDIGVVTGGTFTALFNRSAPSLVAQSLAPIGNFSPIRTRAADLDGDGKTDIAYCHPSIAPYFRVLRNVGTPGAPAFADWLPLSLSGGPRNFILQDLDGDSDVDIVLLQEQGAPLVFPNSGGGVFSGPVSTPFSAGGIGLACGDVNGDGLVDLAVVTSAVGAELRLAAPGFSYGSATQISFGGAYNGIGIGDISGDGRADLLAVLSAPNALEIRLSVAGALGAPVSIPLPANSNFNDQPAIADMDQDGWPDVILCTLSPQYAVLFFRNLGGGVLASPVGFVSGAVGDQVKVGDLDDDGDPDVALLSSQHKIVKILWNCQKTGFTLCEGDGQGTACPCGNTSPVAARAGCLNSLGLAGTLRGEGRPRIGANDFVLRGSGMPNLSALYAQGTTAANNGAGATFGDGLRCAAGSVLRLGTKTNVGNSSRYPDIGDLPVAIKGQITNPGTRYYHCWYRNPANFCTVSTFNLTNGLQVVWSF
ncbi:MAG: VCBS repeat-containing protein [Planctomycetota bacterium]|nr:VCBS repeat-containing protein [Planctomycetota bacterium]